MKQFIFSTLLALFLLQWCSTTLAQPAQAPAPPGPDNITKILEKAGQFTVLIKLMKTTAVGDQINAQLNDSNNGLTVFAPNDNAFASLKSGTLNSLTAEEQVELIQFHVIPTFLSVSQFQTVSNPLRTQAGGSGKFEFPINVMTTGNSVNISTGVNNATVDNTVFSDNQLAVYAVDKVLLPMSIFGPKPPAPAPAPAKLKSKPLSADSPDDNTVPVDDTKSGGEKLVMNALVIFGVTLLGSFAL